MYISQHHCVQYLSESNTDIILLSDFTGVFYCGAQVLEPELRDLARDFSRKTTTKFDFHKENF